MGLGVGTFSMVNAIALASKTPIQMGRTLSDLKSSRTMMGIFDKGSTTSPFIRISMGIDFPESG
jgi:hypothetical protein